MADGGSDDRPLNCVDDAGDGFSGWFAISNSRRCDDFCYWRLAEGDEDGYAAWNTADPHRTTSIETPGGTAHWTCVFDGADDDTTVSSAKGERWADAWRSYSPREDAARRPDGDDVSFPFLRCQKGAGERLRTRAGEAVRSAAFWEGWLFLASLIFVLEFTALVLFCRRGRLRSRYERVGAGSTRGEGAGADDCSSFQMSRVEGGGTETNDGDSSIGNEGHRDGDEDDGGGNGDEDSSFQTRFSFIEHGSFSYASPRCKHCAPLAPLRKDSKLRQRFFYLLRILLVVALNFLLAFAISFSSISLVEIVDHPHFTEGMQKWTPACSNPDLVCPAGNEDVDRPSRWWPPQRGEVHTKKDAGGENNELFPRPRSPPDATASYGMEPFSYIIASDAQLYWFNGEFAEMGREPLPPACAPSDSCGRCTGKQGASANRKLKKAWETLMTGGANGLNASVDLPVPKTLVMNGDLTAYFHPYEKHAYDSIYNDIEGLVYYWPSLGNHDIEHPGGAMFGGDEWIGMPNCNMEHAIGYFKSGFCGQIPAFDTGRIVRYDSSSLAYSWDEGRYHFVHCHYYPSYEMASVNYRSSLRWLERDLRTALEAGLATVLFVHAAQGLNPAMENIILGKNVKAIVAGHTHRCLHRRCEGVYPLHEDQVGKIDSEKCVPAAWDTCEVLNGENLVFVEGMEADVPLPTKKLHNRDRKPDKPLCPQPTPFYINDTDNTLQCRRVRYSEPNFPFERKNNSTETIPIFWSGSSSFETFLRGDFFEDRFVINAMTMSSDDGEVARYVDLRSVPNAIYPHTATDLEETVIYL